MGEVSKVYSKNEFSVCDIVKKKKRNSCYFVVVPQTAKVMAMV